MLFHLFTLIWWFPFPSMNGSFGIFMRWSLQRKRMFDSLTSSTDLMDVRRVFAFCHQHSFSCSMFPLLSSLSCPRGREETRVVQFHFQWKWGNIWGTGEQDEGKEDRWRYFWKVKYHSLLQLFSRESDGGEGITLGREVWRLETGWSATGPNFRCRLVLDLGSKSPHHLPTTLIFSRYIPNRSILVIFILKMIPNDVSINCWSYLWSSYPTTDSLPYCWLATSSSYSDLFPYTRFFLLMAAPAYMAEHTTGAFCGLKPRGCGWWLVVCTE